MVEVEGLLVEAHQEIDRVALRVDLVDADPHLVHARPALDLGRIGPEREGPVTRACGAGGEDVSPGDHALAGLAGETNGYVLTNQYRRKRAGLRMMPPEDRDPDG